MVEFLRDLLGISISVGTVRQVLQLVTQKAGVLNRDQDLSGIRVGLHDEIFHDGKPVLAGVDAASTYCYLLVAAQHRDADTWGVHLLDAIEQGLKPEYTIADAGQGLRAGQKAAWGATPCHGDVFHIQRQCEGLANTLSRLAKGATSRRKALQVKIERAAGQRGPDDDGCETGRYRASPCHCRAAGAGSLSAAPAAQHLVGLLAGLEPASREDGVQVPHAVRRGEQGPWRRPHVAVRW